LFACAAARLYQDQLTPQGRQALEAAERFADDPAAFSGMISAGMIVAAAWQLFRERFPDYDEEWVELEQEIPETSPADHLARAAAYGDAWKAAHTVTSQTIPGLTHKSRAPGLRALLEEVFGNPFAQPAIDRTWLSWNDRTIEKLARTIYQERAFERMPILGDALEEAGCTDQDILEHCRANPSERRHVRGCWVIERLLEASGGLEPSHLEGMAELILPASVWVVEHKKRSKKEFPFAEEVRPHLLASFQEGPLYLVSKACNEGLLEENPDTRAVKEMWFLAEESGIALKAEARGKVMVGTRGRVWLYPGTKRDTAIRDLAEVYEPVKVLLELVKGAPNCRDLARAALEGDRQALANLARILSQAGDKRLLAFQPGLPAGAAPAPAKGPEAELAELQARATPCPRCGKPRLALRVKKEGPNRGRLFLRCTDRSCDSFEWATPRLESPAPLEADPLDLVQRGLRTLHWECCRCGAENPVLARATKLGPNQGRFFLRCNACQKFDWLTDGDGDFLDPDIE
jgi:hypothetical protein